MKPINEYTLQECLDAMKRIDADLLEYGYHEALSDRIEELTRWIPVAERMPTEADADRHGCVLIREVENESPNRVYRAEVRWSDVQKPNYFYTVTDWKRIDP
jgi:hypothetical protein